MQEKKEPVKLSNRYKIAAHVYTSAVSPHANVVLIGSSQGILVLNQMNLTQKTILQPKIDYCPTSLSLSSDGQTFLCWNNLGTVDLWDIASSKFKTIAEHKGRARGQVIYLDNQDAIFCIEQQVSTLGTKAEQYKSGVKFINVQTGEKKATWRLNNSYKNIYLKDNLLIGSADHAQSVDIYDFKHQEFLKEFKPGFPVYKAELSLDNTLLICSGLSSAVAIFNFETGTLLSQIETRGTMVEGFALTSDNKYLAVCERDPFSNQGLLLYFKQANGRLLGEISCGKFLDTVYFDEKQNQILTVDNDGVNLLQYKARKKPSLFPACQLPEKNEPSEEMPQDIEDKWNCFIS